MTGIKTLYKKTLFSVFSLIFIVLYLFSVALVIMFLTSALHIVNPELFQFKKFDLLTGIITVFIIVVSMKAFMKIYKRYYSILSDIFSRNKA
jgi:hypothetical protein